jgi:Plasmid pRiA4b ORF-3-like protein
MSDQHYPLQLTQAQRKVLADLCPAFRERLKAEERNGRTISLTLAEMDEIGKTAKIAVRHVASGMKRNSLLHICDIISESLDHRQGIGSIPAAERIYQFKITLKDIEPPIWRRVQTRDCTLDRLHGHIQLAMGWTNSHLHDFDIAGQKYGDRDLLEETFSEDNYESSLDTKISEILPKSGKHFRFDYSYDWGDGWMHEVLFEGCLRATRGERYPLCVKGERCCPPEDVGGTGGYEEFLATIADPEHEEHDSMLRWVGGKFTPEAFDPAKATKKMRRGLPDWRKNAWV